MPRVKREDVEAGQGGSSSASHSSSLSSPSGPKDTGEGRACHQPAFQLSQPGPRLLSKGDSRLVGPAPPLSWGTSKLGGGLTGREGDSMNRNCIIFPKLKKAQLGRQHWAVKTALSSEGCQLCPPGTQKEPPVCHPGSSHSAAEARPMPLRTSSPESRPWSP